MKQFYVVIVSAFLCYSQSANSQSWWPQNSHSSSDFNEIFYVSDFNGWAFGDSLDALGGFAAGMVDKSINQGALWYTQDMGSPIYQIYGSYFMNNQEGFAVGRNRLSGNGLIIKTIDGAVSWSAAPAQPERLSDVHFADANTGWAVGQNDFIVKTFDAGANWIDISANTGDHLEGVFFTNINNGYVVGRAGNIISSTDGGATWNYLNSGSNADLNAVYFVNDSTGWTVGTAGEILFTNDWGVTWNPQTSGTNEDLNDVAFVDATTGWAVGTAGTVLKTTDAGINWIPETSGTPEDIMSISMRNAGLGWFCGKAGIIYVYGLTPPNALDELAANVLINVSPNPANNVFLIKFSEHINGKIELSDLSGNTVYVEQLTSTSSTVISRNGLASGCYIINVLPENGMPVQKRIILE